MKVTMPQNKLVECLKRGGYASLSDEAQMDTSTLSSIIKSIRIVANEKEITFESATSLVASKYICPVVDDIIVKESGTIMVPSKELYDWVSKQNKSTIGIRLNKFDSPEKLSLTSGESTTSKSSITKLGKVELISKDDSKTGSKWTLDSYDDSILPSLHIKKEFEKSFSVPIEQLKEGIKYTSIFAMPKDSDHLFDTISFQRKDNDIYMLTTDMTRCALCSISNADSINIMESATIEEQKNKDKLWERNLLIPNKILNEVIKLMDSSEEIVFYRDVDKNKIYICQKNGLMIKTACPEKDMFFRFPNINIFLSKDFDPFCKLESKKLLQRLNTVSLVNKNAVLFSFKEDKLEIEAISEMGKSPCKANMDSENFGKDVKSVLNIQDLIDILKVYGGEDIKLNKIEDKEENKVQAIQVLLPDRPNLKYYTMPINDNRYNLN